MMLLCDLVNKNHDSLFAFCFGEGKHTLLRFFVPGYDSIDF